MRHGGKQKISKATALITNTDLKFIITLLTVRLGESEVSEKPMSH